MPTIITCDSCDAKLRTVQALPVGRQVKCPKCGDAIVVSDDNQSEVPAPKPAAAKPAPKKVAVVVEDDEDEDDTPVRKAKPPTSAGSPPARKKVAAVAVENDEDEDRPRRRSRDEDDDEEEEERGDRDKTVSRKRKRRSKKTLRKPNNLPLLVGGGLGFVALVVVVVLLISRRTKETDIAQQTKPLRMETQDSLRKEVPHEKVDPPGKDKKPSKPPRKLGHGPEVLFKEKTVNRSDFALYPGLDYSIDVMDPSHPSFDRDQVYNIGSFDVPHKDIARTHIYQTQLSPGVVINLDTMHLIRVAIFNKPYKLEAIAKQSGLKQETHNGRTFYRWVWPGSKSRSMHYYQFSETIIVASELGTPEKQVEMALKTISITVPVTLPEEFWDLMTKVAGYPHYTTDPSKLNASNGLLYKFVAFETLQNRLTVARVSAYRDLEIAERACADRTDWAIGSEVANKKSELKHNVWIKGLLVYEFESSLLSN